MTLLLFISKGEIIYALILFALLGLHALGVYMMSHFNQISAKVRQMSTLELVEHFEMLNAAFEAKPSFWKAQELREILEERQLRGVFKNMSSEELTHYFEHLSEVCKILPKHSNFGRKKELSFIQNEMKKRQLL